MPLLDAVTSARSACQSISALGNQTLSALDALTPPAAPSHPRLWPNADIRANVALCPQTWQNVIHAAEVSVASPTTVQIAERMACAAAVYRFGLLPGFTYKLSREAYGSAAAADLVNWWSLPNASANTDKYLPHFSLAYDWAPVADSARSEIALEYKHFRDTLESATTGKPNTSVPGWELKDGYDIPAGGIMLSDLAFEPEIPGIVQETLDSCWWAPNPQYMHNWWWHVNQFGERRHPEGVGYSPYTGAMTVRLAQSAYSALTGDHRADDLFCPDFPKWVLFNTEWPLVPGQYLRSLPTCTYSPNGASTQMSELVWYVKLAMETGCGDPQRAALARWLLDQSKGYGWDNASPSCALIGYLVCGDASVKGIHPKDLAA